jgi:hypothetical protein
MGEWRYRSTIFNLGTRCRVISFTSLKLYARGKSHRYPLDRTLGGFLCIYYVLYLCVYFRKILTHGYCELRKEVTAAGMKITRCAKHRRKRRNKDDVERETRKGRTKENRRRKGPQCKTEIKDPTMNDIEGWNSGERAPLGSGGTCKKGICDIFRDHGTCSRNLQ